MSIESAPIYDSSSTTEVPSASTVSTPHGEMHLMGANSRTGQIILANSEGLVETTPEELGAWQMLADGERFREAETAEDAGEVAVENTVKLPENIQPEEPIQALGEMVLRDTTTPDSSPRRPTDTNFDIELGDDDVVDEEEAESHVGDGGGSGPPEEPPELPPGDGEDEPEDEPDAGDTYDYDETTDTVTMDPEYEEDEADDIPVVDPERDEQEARARLAHLRMETVDKARELGATDPIEYLVKARSNPNMVKRMEQRGWDMSPPPENESHLPRDPVAINAERGDRSRKEVNEIIRMIESPEGQRELRAALKRPGELPLGLHHVPIFGRRLGRRTLAWRIYLRERSKRPHEKEYTMTDGSKEVRPIVYNDGLLGLGTHHVREILNGLESLDESIKVNRSKLSRMNGHKVMGDLITARRDLAQQIDRDLRSLIKLRVLKTERLGFYEHAPFKNMLKEYEAYKDPRVMAEERNDFIRLRFLEVRNPQQQQRFEELLAKHPNWA